MNAADLLLDLDRRGIRLEAQGDRLRYHPRSALTPELLARLKAHKADLLAMLRPATKAASARPAATWDAPATPTAPVCRCGSTTWRDVPIHDGQSVRRDCAGCRRFLNFPVWHGIDTGHNGQHPIG